MLLACAVRIPTNERNTLNLNDPARPREKSKGRKAETHVASLLRSLAEDQPPPRLLPHSDLHPSNQPVHSLPS